MSDNANPWSFEALTMEGFDKCIGYLMMCLDAKISNDLLTLEPRMITGTIESPFAVKWMEEIGSTRYGSIKPIMITVPRLERTIHRNFNALDAGDIFASMLPELTAPIEAAYYFCLLYQWISKYGNKNDSAYELKRGTFWAYVKNACSQAVNDSAAYSDQYTGDEPLTDDLLKMIIDEEYIDYLYFCGTFKEREKPDQVMMNLPTPFELNMIFHGIPM